MSKQFSRHETVFLFLPLSVVLAGMLSILLSVLQPEIFHKKKAAPAGWSVSCLMAVSGVTDAAVRREQVVIPFKFHENSAARNRMKEVNLSEPGTVTPASL